MNFVHRTVFEMTFVPVYVRLVYGPVLPAIVEEDASYRGSDCEPFTIARFVRMRGEREIFHHVPSCYTCSQYTTSPALDAAPAPRYTVSMSADSSNSPVEYLVLGDIGFVTTGGREYYLGEVFGRGSTSQIKEVLDSLGEEGWEAVLLDKPYIFMRRITKMEAEITRLARQFAVGE